VLADRPTTSEGRLGRRLVLTLEKHDSSAHGFRRQTAGECEDLEHKRAHLVFLAVAVGDASMRRAGAGETEHVSVVFFSGRW